MSEPPEGTYSDSRRDTEREGSSKGDPEPCGPKQTRPRTFSLFLVCDVTVCAVGGETIITRGVKPAVRQEII